MPSNEKTTLFGACKIEFFAGDNVLELIPGPSSGTVEIATTLSPEAPLVSELAASGTVVAQVVTDVPADCAITTDDGNLFAMTDGGQIVLVGVLDFDAASVHEVGITCFADGGVGDEVMFEIGVADADTISLNPSAPVVPEDTVIGVEVASIVAPNGPCVLSDDAGGLFTVNSNGNIAVAAPLDFEQAIGHEITVVCGPLSETFTIGVSDVEDIPLTLVVSPSSPSVSELASVGATVFSIATNQEATCTLVGGGSTFELDVINNIVNGTANVVLTGPLDFETTASYPLQIICDDGETQPQVINVTVSVTDEAEANIAMSTPPILPAVAGMTVADAYVAGSYTPGGVSESITYTVDGVVVTDMHLMKQGEDVSASVVATNATGSLPAVAVGGVVPFATMATQVAEIEAAFAADPEGSWDGWSLGEVDQTFIANTPDEARAFVEAWRPDPSQVILIDLNWDGPMNLTNASLRGPVASLLTADATEMSGYARPDGGVWLRAASGREPAFGNSFTVSGMPRIIFDGIDCSVAANGGNGDNIGHIRFQNNSTFPLQAVVIYRNGFMGLDQYDPLAGGSEFVKGIICNTPIYSLLVEDSIFASIRDQIQGRAKFLRVRRNSARKFLSDFVTQAGFITPEWAGERVYAIIEGNALSDSYDVAGFDGLHTDFYQSGNFQDIHAGLSLVVRYNVAHMSTSQSFDSASQFVYNDDHTNAWNNIVVHDNIAAFSAFNGSVMHDTTGLGNFFTKNNLFMRSGNYNQTFGAEVFPRIHLNTLAGSQVGVCEGRVEIEDNYVTLITGGAALTSVTGNFFIDPRDNIPAGQDGSSTALAARPEEVFSGAFVRSAGDRLSYTLPGEGQDPATVVIAAMAAFFEPLAGWGVQAGPSDPATWPI